MWNARVFRTSSWEELPVVEIGEFPVIDAILFAARQRLPRDLQLIQHLEAEAQAIAPDAFQVLR